MGLVPELSYIVEFQHTVLCYSTLQSWIRPGSGAAVIDRQLLQAMGAVGGGISEVGGWGGQKSRWEMAKDS